MISVVVPEWKSIRLNSDLSPPPGSSGVSRRLRQSPRQETPGVHLRCGWGLIPYSSFSGQKSRPRDLRLGLRPQRHVHFLLRSPQPLPPRLDSSLRLSPSTSEPGWGHPTPPKSSIQSGVKSASNEVHGGYRPPNRPSPSTETESVLVKKSPSVFGSRRL